MALEKDPSTMSSQSLNTIANDEKHPLHTHAKAELARRNTKKEGYYKRIATSQSSKPDRMAPGKGLDTFKKKEKEEKTLTPNELKKRKEIAKAIKKDDPDMPMDKKMAIATATAKRVAEYGGPPISRKAYLKQKPMTNEAYKVGQTVKPTKGPHAGHDHEIIHVHGDGSYNIKPKNMPASMNKYRLGAAKAKHDDLKEISQKKLSDYMRKSADDAGKPRQDARTQDKRIGGQKMADDKMRKMQGKGSAAKVPATESTDESYTDVPKVGTSMRQKRKNAAHDKIMKHAKARATANVLKKMNSPSYGKGSAAKVPATESKVDELSLSMKDITKSGISPVVTKDKEKIKKDLAAMKPKEATIPDGKTAMTKSDKPDLSVDDKIKLDKIMKMVGRR